MNKVLPGEQYIAAFVMGHYGQGMPRAVFLAVFSFVCHVLVRTTGTL